MGIQGARSLLDHDPPRYGRPWTCNWDAGEEKEEIRESQDEPIYLLIDGTSLLYYIAVDQENSNAACPASVKERISMYVSQLLKALPERSEVRIFMDGLAPKAKISAQVSRMRDQAIKGDNQAKNGSKTRGKILDLLAEFAMVEAIEDLSKSLKEEKTLALHRASRGEAEAYIDYWISRKLPKNANTYILADDTDFLVYPNCPGFVPFQSLEIQSENGQFRLSGFQYLRKLFLESFLTPGVVNEDIMPVIAALAGCDYTLHPDAQEGLEKARNVIVKSDIGGLREKARNKPTKSQTFTAILRYVAHFFERDEENWVFDMIQAATAPNKKASNGSNNKAEEEVDPSAKNTAATILTDAFIAIRKIYFRSLTLPTNPEFEKRPPSLEIRRLLEYGILYCRPIVESWGPTSVSAPSRKRSLGDIHSALDSRSCAVVISPPFTRQVASWLEQDSVWRMPHFCQARLRLYCLLVQFACTGGSYSFEGGQLRLSPMWTNENPKVIEYTRSNNNGGKDPDGEPSLRMLEKEVEIPGYEYVSAGWGDESELLSGDEAVDRACLFCLIGNIKQARPGLNPSLRSSGTLFLASLLLPFNLSLLLILLGTSPRLDEVEFRPVEETVSLELTKVLPFMSAACYHAIFIASTLSSLYGTHSEEQRRSNLTGSGDDNPMGLNVSSTIRRDEALWIWRALRQGDDLEQLKSDDSDDVEEMQYAMDYLENVINLLKDQVPQNNDWRTKMKEWKQRAKVLWVIWWEVFNVALTNES